MPGFQGTTRDYDNDHVKARAAAFAALPEWSPCVRCHRPMWKWAKTKPDRLGRTRSALHYDHNNRRDGYLGFSHKRCNLHAAASRGGQMRAARHGPWRGARRSSYWN